MAEVTAIFKKRDKLNHSNYRSVFLTCIICKVLECFVRDFFFQKQMGEINLYSNCQNRIRKNKYFVTQPVNVMGDFIQYFNGHEPFDTDYFDNSKAFDTVPHDRSLIKLGSYGIVGIWIGLNLS